MTDKKVELTPAEIEEARIRREAEMNFQRCEEAAYAIFMEAISPKPLTDNPFMVKMPDKE